VISGAAVVPFAREWLTERFASLIQRYAGIQVD
jgi:hypothetical protein